MGPLDVPLTLGGGSYPIADLDFAGGVYRLGGLTLTDASALPGWSFTRASAGYGQNSAGLLIPFASGVPRIVPGSGILIEEARTNSIRNNTVVGAVAGTPGTSPTNWSIAVNGNSLTQQIVGTGVENGVTYIDVRFSGTTTNSNGVTITPEGGSIIAASNGQAWSYSAYISVVAGSFTNVSGAALILDQNNSGGAYLSQLNGPAIEGSISATLTRFSMTATTNNASIAFIKPYLFIHIFTGKAVDFTLRFGLPQAELGSFGTSPIITTGSTATRAADVGYIDLTVPAQWTIYGQATFPANDAANNKNVGGLAAGASTANRAAIIRTAAGALQEFAVSGGGVVYDQTTAASGAITAAGAISHDGTTYRAAARGVALPSTVAAAPVGLSRLWLGIRTDGAAHWTNGYVPRLIVNPFAMSTAQMQGMTA